MRLHHLTLAVLLGLGTTAAAQAATISWNTWTSASAGTLTSGSDTIAITYAGPGTTYFAGYPSYTPTSSYADGSFVDNAPVAANGIVQLVGGTGDVQTLSFSKPITDPVVAIWSLGSPSTPASFVFQGATPIFVAGGPNAEYGGSAITVSGNTVSGSEGNGTVRFVGTYSSLSWTNPQYESWYGFNVGVAGVAAVPEPASAALALGGLALVAGAVSRRRRG